MHCIDDLKTPLEMVEILEELKNKISGNKDLSPSDYLERDVRMLYSIAHKHYSINNYTEAEPLFTNLVLARPLEKIYWRGLASSRQMLKNYDGSLICWGMVALIDAEDLSAHIFGAECLYHLGAIEEAEKALLHIEKTITEAHPNYQKYYKISLSVRGI